jgi:hypothetical protein
VVPLQDKPFHRYFNIIKENVAGGQPIGLSFA